MEILDVHFYKAAEQGLEFEVLPLEALFARKLGHSLEQPQRPHFYLLMVIAEGQGTHHIDFKPYAYDPSSLLLVAKGQVQRFEVNPLARGFLLVFTAKFLYQEATAGDIKRSLQLFDYTRHPPRLVLPPDERPRVLGLVEHIWQEYRHPADSLRAEILRTQLRLLLLRLERLRNAHRPELPAPEYRAYLRLRELLEDGLGQSHSVQHYAQRLNLSPKKLNRLTQQLLGKTAKAFIDEALVLEIQRHLAEADLSVKEVAFALGFDEVTNMVKFFKKHTGLTPSGFREGLRLA